MKHLTTEQINIISEMILNEQISFNSDKIQATDSTTYANNQEDPGAVHNTYRWFGQNSTTLWLAALGVGLVVLPPALRKYASNKLRRELPKGTQITEKMRLKYFLRDMISNGLLSHIPVAGKYLSVPSYLEELKKQLKKEVERTKSTLTDPKSSRATKQAARESLNYMEHIPGVLDGYKLKLMNQAVSEYYTNPKFTINDLLRTTGWAADAKLATKAQVRMPILKKIFDKKYIPQEVPAQLIPGQMKFNKYLESQPNLQKSLDKISGIQSAISYSVIDKLQNTQKYKNAVYQKYLNLINDTKLNYSAIDAYYSASGKFPDYRFWKEMETRAGSKIFLTLDCICQFSVFNRL